MEITIDTIISIIGLLLGDGSIGSVVAWRYARKRAIAEARQAEAEAKRAEAEASKEKQDYYQQMVEDVSKDRDYYKQERDELRKKLDDLTRSVFEWKQTSEDERLKMKQDINLLRRQMDCLRPMLCGREGCQIRVPVNISAMGEVAKTGEEVATASQQSGPSQQMESRETSDIEPVISDVL